MIIKIRICYDNYADFKASLWALEQSGCEIIAISKSYFSHSKEGKTVSSNYVSIKFPDDSPSFGSFDKNFLKCKNLLK